MKYQSFTALQHRQRRFQLSKEAKVDVEPSPFLAERLNLSAAGRLPQLTSPSSKRGRKANRSPASRKHRGRKKGHRVATSPLRSSASLPTVLRNGSGSPKAATPAERALARKRLQLPKVLPEVAMLAQRAKLREVLFPDRNRSPDLAVKRMAQLGRINNIIKGQIAASNVNLSKFRNRVGGGVGSWIVRQNGVTSTMDLLRCVLPFASWLLRLS